ncbi:MAG TPA: hypothetical protein VE996_08310 [Terriglobales bacterium]|nr:hypothetical protein [Terriglobales bacterium]
MSLLDAIALRSLIPRLAGLGDDRFPRLRASSGGCPPLEQALLLRLAAAFRTPSDWPQPPELAGVDASVQVPNALQPMSGEFAAGREVADGQPSFFGFRLAGLPPRAQSRGRYF